MQTESDSRTPEEYEPHQGEELREHPRPAREQALEPRWQRLCDLATD